MEKDLHGETCTIILFVEPAGELEGILLVEGSLDLSGDVPLLLPEVGGDAIRIPEHLEGLVEIVTDEHRECLEDLSTPYCLRAFYDGRLASEGGIDMSAILARSSAESAE